MGPDALYLLVVAVLAVPLFWLLPRPVAPDAVALWTIASLAFLSPLTAGWLSLSAAGTIGVLSMCRHIAHRGAMVGLWTVILLAGFFVSRDTPRLNMIGAAYFTLRNLHVLFDGYLHRETPAGLRQMFRYQFFAPVLVVGPIHRFPNFNRNLERSRLDTADLAAGAERALTGLFIASLLGLHLMGKVLVWYSLAAAPWPVFWFGWGKSALEWIQLYFVFAGFSGIAIGLSRMMGIVIEENFNHPYRATSLLDFWTRWHISLSFWCRDYVFQTVSAITRRPILGLLAAMTAIGIWHETSAFYLLWALWQVAGIVLNRMMITFTARRGWHLPPLIKTVVTPIAILGWLSLARPAINHLLGLVS
jgi:alginate O-acetyltransferase complex protein AlgI